MRREGGVTSRISVVGMLQVDVDVGIITGVGSIISFSLDILYTS